MRLIPLLILLAACSNGSSDDKTDTDDTVVADTDAADTDAADTDITPDQPTCPEGAEHAVLTTKGCVLGTATDEGEAFLGIPYAKPPVGDRRWKRPESISPWSEPLTANDPGPVCPQTNGTPTGTLDPLDGDEDCLRLNVLRPAGASGLPILFFIHGGGNVDGAGSEDLYLDNPGLAKNAILVTHNYRLGPLGFLAHPKLSLEDPEGVSGNQGLRDSILALKFIRDNAAAFGGDPDKILLFGESAGSIDACALWLSPETQGWFAGVIGESGPCTSLRTPLKGALNSGESFGQRFATEASCDTETDVLACLRTRTVHDILRYLPGRQGPVGDGEDYGPVIDGKVLPKSAKKAAADGDVPNVPMMLTVNADEATLFIPADSIADDGAYKAALLPYAILYGLPRPLTDGVRTLHDAWDPVDYGGDANAAFRAFNTDALFVCPTRQWLNLIAPHAPAYGMYFARPLLGSEPLGAIHGAELPYVFGTITPFAAAEDLTLSTTLQAAWTSMASGTPSIAGVATWPTIDAGWVQVGADASVSTIDDLEAEKCAILGM